MQSRRTDRRAGAHKPAVRRVAPPTLEELNLWADAMPTRMLRSFVLCAAWSGLRLFETAALEWPDVIVNDDGRTARLHVRHGKGYAGVSKERWSVLLQPGLDATLEMLPRGERVGRVFHTERYGLITKQYVNKKWLKVRGEIGLDRFVFHDLRKFHATWLLDHGVSDMDVAITLGHIDHMGRPNPELVRKVYGFADTREALRRIEGL